MRGKTKRKIELMTDENKLPKSSIILESNNPIN